MSFFLSGDSGESSFIRGRAVGDSNDLRRVLALPRRNRPSPEALQAMADALKAEFGKGDVPCVCETKFKRRCCKDMLLLQAWLLTEAREVGGILGPVGVGHGKSLCDLLVAMVVPETKTAVLLLPPNLKSQMLEVDWHFYGQHWKLPNLAGGKFYYPGRPTLHVVAYSELSGSRATDLLQRLRPDLVALDEAHSVRNRTAARTKRFLRYFQQFPNTKLFAWSGTLTSRSLKDYAHLSAFALRDNSPAPLHWPTVEEWAGHLDASDVRTPAGRLSAFGEDARVGFGQWLVNSKGVISSGDSESCQASLIISERKIEAPEQVKKLIADLEDSWTRPDGEELVDAMSMGRCAKQLSCGFYYRWRWPRKEPVEVIERWLLARKNWHKELREKLKHAQPHMDSPLLLAKAAIRYFKGYVHVTKEKQLIKNIDWRPNVSREDDPDGQYAEFIEADVETERKQFPPGTAHGPLPTWKSEFWQEWETVRDTAKPETEAIWVSDFFVEDCVAWLKEGPGLLWYEFDGLARRVNSVARGSGVDSFVHVGPGEDGNQKVISLGGAEAALISIRAHGTGKNLQQFYRNLVANPPSSGSDWEQLLGRTHRAGQKADEVTFEVYRHTEPFRKAVEKARDLSEYIEESFGATQKLASRATWNF